MDDLTPLLPAPVYAGFWRRFNAYGIDATFVVIIAWLLDMVLPGSAMAQTPEDFQKISDLVLALQTGQVTPERMAMVRQSLKDSMLGGSMIPIDTILLIVTSAVYNILFVISDWQATPGKHWLGMKVVTKQGEKLNWLQSTLRHVTSGLAMLPLGLGNITIFYSREKCAPHDFICGTRVVRLPPQA
ncbi:MAG: RDD family protein [Rickettsiales bacterium]